MGSSLFLFLFYFFYFYFLLFYFIRLALLYWLSLYRGKKIINLLFHKRKKIIRFENNIGVSYIYIYITFMHLADAFIQSDLHCIQVTVFYILSALALPRNRTHDLGVASAMLYHLSYRKANDWKIFWGELSV